MENIKIKVKKLMAKFLIKVGNKYYLDKFTNGIGRLVEEDDKFICYVDNKKIKNDKYGNTELFLGAFNSYLKDMRSVYKFYNVNKPIYYVIDGYRFGGVLFLGSFGEVYVTFNNCEFNDNIIIRSANSVTFVDNKYNNHYSIYYGNAKTFLEGVCKELKFINDKFYNSDDNHHPCFFGLNVVSDRLEIINSSIIIDNAVTVDNKEVVKNRGSVSIKSKEIVLRDSVIKCPEIYLSYENSDIINSSIIGSNGIIIDDKSNKTDINCISAPYFVYNNEQVIEGVKRIEELSAKRKELTNFLINLRNTCFNINNSKSVSKVLKK